MTTAIYLFFFTALAVTLELILRSFGLFLPLAGLLLFYMTVVFGYKTAGGLALLAACGLDFVSGSQHPNSLIAFSAVIGLSCFWLYRIESESIFLHIVPGGLIPLIAWLFALPFYPGSLFSNLFYQLPGVIIAAFVCAFLLPVEIFLFDTLNEKLGFDLYTNAKIRIKSQQ